MAVHSPNRDYWANRSGEDYRHQQDIRRTADNPSYAQQERWLLACVQRLHQDRRGAPLRVLDFGCGFGRFARLIADLPYVDYHGYDVSQTMVAPLLADPPEALRPKVGDHVRVADNLDDAYPTHERFDLIFTVSVLIHNPPEIARGIVDALLDRLAPGGRLVLIENALTAVSAMENLWHGGCWAHCFARDVNGRADVEVTDHFAGRHGLYVITPLAEARESRFTFRDANDADPQSLTLSDLLLKGLDNAARVSADMSREVAAATGDNARALGELRDLVEAQERENIALSQRIATLTDELNALQRQHDALNNEAHSTRARFAERQRLLEAIQDASRAGQDPRRPHPGGHVAHGAAAPRHPGVEINALRDVRYAHDIPGLQGLAHVFHAEWVGIRAAVGSLPGEKIAIPAMEPLSQQQLLEATARLTASDCRRIVFHGYSERAGAIIAALAAEGLAERVYLIHHGNPAQWCYDGERRAAYAVLKLASEGKLRRFHFMKAGFEAGCDNAYRPMLFNLSPRIMASAPLPPPATAAGATLFAPAWPDWRKNLYTGLFAACLSPAVSKVMVHADGLELPPTLTNKLVHHHFVDREQTFDLIRASTLCLNASIVDCHPMVNLEAQALGKACIRGPLHLDALEDHPYVRLTEVSAVMSIAETRAVIERLLGVPEQELQELARDYQVASDAVARERYFEFLEI